MADLIAAARATILDPRAGARAVLRLNPPMGARWMLMVLTAAISSVLTHLSFLLVPAYVDAGFSAMLGGPLRTAIWQGAGTLVLTALVQGIGKLFGGKGRFADALLLIGWLQVILLMVQAAQLLLMLALPPIADLMGILGLVLLFWLLSAFTAELHGFSSALKVFLSMIGLMVAIWLVLSLLVIRLGVVGT